MPGILHSVRIIVAVCINLRLNPSQEKKQRLKHRLGYSQKSSRPKNAVLSSLRNPAALQTPFLALFLRAAYLAEATS